jgi:hypothetical protein
VDTNKVELTGANGGPVQHEVGPSIDVKVLTDDELALFEELLIKTLPHNDSQM